MHQPCGLTEVPAGDVIDERVAAAADKYERVDDDVCDDVSARVYSSGHGDPLVLTAGVAL